MKLLTILVALAACTDAQADRPTPTPAPTMTIAPHAGIRTTRPSKAELKKELTPDQYAVTQEDATEPPFHNAYWDNHAPGIYVDVTTGQPLFTSLEKFDSGTGWPSFWAPIDRAAVVEKHDSTVGMERTEVRSKVGDAHLGHVFDDGPRPTGLRYCMNSASLRFVPADQLVAQGYGQFAARFATAK